MKARTPHTPLDISTAPGKRGPKLTPINWAEFEKLCQMQCTLREIASYFDCSEDTIERAVEREQGVKFAEYFGQKRGRGKYPFGASSLNWL